MNSVCDNPEGLGFPIRKSSDQSLFAGSPRLIAGYNVLLRLLLPRHPPCALKNLTTDIKDARVHCAVLKLRAAPPTTHAYTPQCAVRWNPVVRPARPPYDEGSRPEDSRVTRLSLQDPTVCLAAAT